MFSCNSKKMFSSKEERSSAFCDTLASEASKILGAHNDLGPFWLVTFSLKYSYENIWILNDHIFCKTNIYF